jgi:hypothetical protein
MRNQGRLGIWLSGVAVTVYSSSLLTEPPRLALSRGEIAAAIEWGRTARPEGYTLRNSAGQRVGALYTPYLRVALAARFAAERNQPFNPHDVSPRVIDPRGQAASGEAIVYIAMRVDGTDLRDDYAPGLAVRLLHGGSGGAATSLLARSSSTTTGRARRFGPAYLQYGLDPNVIYVLASFPHQQVRRASQVELFDSVHGKRWREGAHAIITESELSEWK